MKFTQHPLSAAFPAMQDEDYQALLDSVGDLGVQNPITLLDGMVLDGWHRYSAAVHHGMACPAVELANHISPRDFVLAQNRARRHITTAQLAMAANAVYQWQSAGRPSANSALSAQLKQPEIADKAGVSIRSLQQASNIEKTAAPEVVAAVKRGEVGLPKATAIAKLPIAEQAAALHKPAPKPAKPTPVVEPAHAAPTDYTKLDAAYDQISELQSELVVARMGDIPEEDKRQAATLIAELRAEVKTLEATLKAVALSRDQLMEERSQMLRQMAMQRKDIEKLKASK